jgi:diketogulonate reductase-like aldo/keto reductase
MIPILTKHRIQSEAYEKLLEALAWGVNPLSVIEPTRKLLEAVSFDIVSVLHELARTRLKRLPRTQFVYWAERRGHPRIENNGTSSYLQEHAASFRMPLNHDMLDRLKEHEAQLFDCIADVEAVVYWRGWHLIADSESDLVYCNVEYCMAYIWNDEVHQETRTQRHQ